MSVVRVKNLRDVALVDAFDGTTYSVEPGGEAVVPLDAAKLWFGDWDTVNRPERALRERDNEHQRLLIRYGCRDNPTAWEETKPLVLVTDVSGDTAHTTVIEDPSGSSVSEASMTVDQQTDMLAMIRKQAKDLDLLKKKYAAESRSDQPDADADEDSPEPVPSKRARRQ